MTKLIFRFFLLTFIGYNIYIWKDQIESEKNNIVIEKVIQSKFCSRSSRSSSIKIKHYNEFIWLDISRQKCEKLKVGDKIPLIYSKKRRVFYLKGKRKAKFLIFFTMVAFILSFFKQKNRNDNYK